MTDALDQLEAGLDRAGMESLIAKLRRRPDRTEGGFDQSAEVPEWTIKGYNFTDANTGRKINAEPKRANAEVRADINAATEKAVDAAQAKIDVNTGPTVNLTFGGSMNYSYGSNYSYGGSLLNFTNFGLF
jgi:hypothetical protein